MAALIVECYPYNENSQDQIVMYGSRFLEFMDVLFIKCRGISFHFLFYKSFSKAFAIFEEGSVYSNSLFLFI